MTKRIINITTYLLILLTLVTPLSVYATSVSSSINANTIEVGKTAVITVSVPGEHGMLQFNVSNSPNLKVSSNNVVSDKNIAQITVTGLSAGKGSVTINGFGAVDPSNRLNINKTFTVTVNPKPQPKPDPKPTPPKPDPTPSKPSTPAQPSKPGSSLPQIDNTEQEKAGSNVTEKSAEEIEREELAKRMKTPLIKDIEIVSNSERLKGEVLHTIEPESEKFDYSKTLARNVEDVVLKIRTIAGDVKLDYKENISFDEGKDSIEVIIKAKQDKLEQEFKLTLKKPEESKFIVDHDSKKLKLIVDPYMDKAMEGLGFEKHFIVMDDESQGFYYSLENKNLILVADEENNAYTYLVDKDLKVIEEVFIVSNGQNKASLLVNRILGEEDKRTINGNEYEIHEVTISKLLTELDPGMKFNNRIGAWTFDENGIISYGLGDEDEAELVYLDRLGNLKNSFVAFDIVPEKEINILAIVGFSLWILTLISFVVYGVKVKNKAKKFVYS